MDTNRLLFQTIDQGVSSPTSPTLSGYFVVKAQKGTTLPTFINPGDVSSLLSIFGTPSYTYPGVQEVLDYIGSYGAWVSAPPGIKTGYSSYYDGCYLTSLGTLESFATPVTNSVVFTTGDVTENYGGTPNIGYNIQIVTSNLGSTFTTTTPTSTNIWINGSNITATSSGIVIDNIPNTYFNATLLNGITLQANAGHGISAWTYDFQYNPTGYGGGSGFYLMSAPQVIATGATSIVYGTVATGTLGSGYTKITFLAPVSDTHAPNLTAANLTTQLAAVTGGNIPSTFTMTLNMNIAQYVLVAFYQSSIRNTLGTLTLNSLDLRPFVINAGATGVAFTSPTLTSNTTASFTVSSVAGALAGNITIGTVPIVLTSGNIASVTACAAAIASALATATGWTVTSSVGLVNISTVSNLSSDPNFNKTYNTATISYTEPNDPYGANIQNLVVSTLTTATDKSGSSIYINNLLGSNIYLNAVINVNSSTGVPHQFSDTLSGITWSTPLTNSFQGNRIVSSSAFLASDVATSLQPGWNLAVNDPYQDVSLFVDPENQATFASTFVSLRNTNYKFSTFISGIRVPNGIPQSPTDVQNATNAIIAARAGYPNLTGLAYYCNELLVQENYTQTQFWNVPTGSIAAMLTAIIDQNLGGSAPMFTNENGLGGQINKVAIASKYKFTANQLDQLDAAAINPVVKDNFYGIMLTSQRTAQSPVNVTDWSFLGHQMSFDLLRKQIRQYVMLPQIGKAIDTYHMNLRASQANIYLNQRLNGANPIWNAGKIHVLDVNTPATKAQNQFVIFCEVQVNPFSETVLLVFENIGQTSTVS